MEKLTGKDLTTPIEATHPEKHPVEANIEDFKDTKDAKWEVSTGLYEDKDLVKTIEPKGNEEAPDFHIAVAGEEDIQKDFGAEPHNDENPQKPETKKISMNDLTKEINEVEKEIDQKGKFGI